MDSQEATNLLIETNELATLIENNTDNLKIVCGTWNWGAEVKDPVEQFTESHIPGSVYFSIVDIADKSSS